MKRSIRALATVGLSISLSAVAGAGIAGAQEMDHGRTRPTSRQLQSNVVKTADSVANSYVGNVRG